MFPQDTLVVAKARCSTSFIYLHKLYKVHCILILNPVENICTYIVHIHDGLMALFFQPALAVVLFVVAGGFAGVVVVVMVLVVVVVLVVVAFLVVVVVFAVVVVG